MFIVGGPDRPPSKRLLDQLKSDGAAMQPGTRRTNASQPEGYWEYMQRQITERTEKLGNLQENMGKLEESSSSWATEAGKFVQKQKRNMVMGVVKSKFGI